MHHRPQEVKGFKRELTEQLLFVYLAAEKGLVCVCVCAMNLRAVHMQTNFAPRVHAYMVNIE